MTRVLLLMRTRTYRAAPFLAAAERLGLAVSVATERSQPLSGLLPGALLDLDYSNVSHMRERVVQFARSFPIDAVVGLDDDTTVQAAEVAHALGLPHNSIDSVKAARYKDVMRLALSEADIRSPGYTTFSIEDDARRIAQLVRYPCVLKPLTLAASRGVIRANDPEQFECAFRDIVAILGEADLPQDDPAAHQILVEDFLPGQEVALEGLLRDGQLVTLALFDKPDPLDGPYFEETIYVTPSRLTPAAQAAVAEEVARAAAALGLRTGPLHAELRLNDGGVWIVEVAARSIGGLCSRTLRFDGGLSLEEIILRQATGLDLGSLERERRPAGVMMIPIPRAGWLHEVRGIAEAEAVPGVEHIEISIPCGEQVVPLPRATRYLGFIFAQADTPQAVEAALRAAHARLAFDIRPEAAAAAWP